MVTQEEWLMILGDDDYLSEDAIEGFYKTIEALDFNIKVLRFGAKVFTQYRATEIIQYKDLENSADFFSKKAVGEVRASLSEYVFRIESLKEDYFLSYPNAFYSDHMLVLLCSHFGKIKNIKFGYVNIRISSISLTGKMKENRIEEAASNYYLDLYIKYKDYFTVDQMRNFIPFIINGYKNRYIDIKLFNVFEIISVLYEFPKNFRVIFSVLKFRFLK